MDEHIEAVQRMQDYIEANIGGLKVVLKTMLEACSMKFKEQKC